MKVQLTNDTIKAILSKGEVLDTSGAGNLLRGRRSKAYYCGGGWWRFEFYSSGRRYQIEMMLKIMKRIGPYCKGCGRVCVESVCMDCYYIKNMRD